MPITVRASAMVGLAVAPVLAALAPTPAGASTRHPDLRPSAVHAIGWADPADALPSELTITNRGDATSRRTTAHLYLSTDKSLSKQDHELRGAVAVPALRPGRKVTVAPALTPGAGVRLGRFWLLACVGGRCAPSAQQVHVTATPRTSGDLIDAANLSAGTKIVYKVYAAVGDPRLPAAYRGDNPPLFGDLALSNAQAQWSQLSAQQQALISPLLQGPSGPGGYQPAARPAAAREAGRTSTAAADCPHTGPTGMKHVDAPGGQIRIWYPAKGVPAVAAATPELAQDAAKIWARYKALMGREPPSDADFCGFNGGDGHFDVYLVDNDLNGFVKGYAITTNYKGHHQTGGPSFTVFNCWANDPPDGWQLAHELFHAFQFAYAHAAELDSYAGFDEGAADWAANWLYPKADWEHSDDEMLTYPDQKSDTFPNNSFGYELWAFDLYLTERFGNQLIPQIYDQFQHEDELTALNSVIPGGWEDRLKDFTLYGWNQDPAPDGFRSWDRLASVPEVAYQQPVVAKDLHLGDLESRTLNLPDKLAPLTRLYQSFHVDDSHIHDLVFHNTAQGTQGASVQAFVKLADGTWKTQDWTDKKTVEFCRDEGPDQNVTDLVLMYANARYQDTEPLDLAKQPTLELRNNCDRYYRVTAVTGSYDEHISVADTSQPFPCTDTGTVHYSLTLDPSGHLGVTDGSYTPHGLGLVFAPATLTGTRDYDQTCTGPAGTKPDLQPCHADLSAQVSYLVDIGDVLNDTDPVPTQLRNPQHQDPLDEACDDEGYGWFNSDNPVTIDAASVPIATLEGTAPFTISGTNSYDDHAGHTYATSLSVTLQPTDAEGNPLE